MHALVRDRYGVLGRSRAEDEGAVYDASGPLIVFVCDVLKSGIQIRMPEIAHKGTGWQILSVQARCERLPHLVEEDVFAHRVRGAGLPFLVDAMPAVRPRSQG